MRFLYLGFFHECVTRVQGQPRALGQHNPCVYCPEVNLAYNWGKIKAFKGTIACDF